MRSGIDLLGTLTRPLPGRRPPEIDFTSVRSVLVVKISSMGDVIHALPLATALRRVRPDLELSWVVEDRFAPLLEGHPALDRVVAIPRIDARNLLGGGLASLRRALRGLEPDLALDLHGLLKSALVAKLAGARARLGIEGQREGSHLLTAAVPFTRRDLHVVDENLELARFLGAPDRPVTFDLPVAASARERVADLLASEGIGRSEPIVVLAPSASSRAKSWPLDRWAALARSVARFARPVVTGAAENRSDHARVAASGAADLTGRTGLADLVALLERSSVHVAHDTGSAHVAAALGRRVVGVYGPTDPERSAPWGQRERVLSGRDLCGGTCPTVCLRGRRCVAEIRVDAVLREIERALAP